MFRKVLLWLALPMIAAAVTAYALVTTGAKVRQPFAELAEDPIRPVMKKAPDRIWSGALWPQLRWYLKALGDRLEAPGKERLTLAGTLERAGENTVVVAAISEFPDRLSLTTQSSTQLRSLTYDGQAAHVVGGTLSVADQDLIESLVNDTAEHFFAVQAQGAPTRHLGNHFRADDGATESYTGPYHDVFSIQDRVTIGSATRSQPRLYYFNSDTHLLEKVTYQNSRNGQTIDVETQFSGWERIQEQQIAKRIVRFENGQQVISLTITGASLGPRLNDGVF